MGGAGDVAVRSSPPLRFCRRVEFSTWLRQDCGAEFASGTGRVRFEDVMSRLEHGSGPEIRAFRSPGPTSTGTGPHGHTPHKLHRRSVFRATSGEWTLHSPRELDWTHRGCLKRSRARSGGVDCLID
jgi:hypothetical protein